MRSSAAHFYSHLLCSVLVSVSSVSISETNAKVGLFRPEATTCVRNRAESEEGLSKAVTGRLPSV